MLAARAWVVNRCIRELRDIPETSPPHYEYKYEYAVDRLLLAKQRIQGTLEVSDRLKRHDWLCLPRNAAPLSAYTPANHYVVPLLAQETAIRGEMISQPLKLPQFASAFRSFNFLDTLRPQPA